MMREMEMENNIYYCTGRGNICDNVEASPEKGFRSRSTEARFLPSSSPRTEVQLESRALLERANESIECERNSQLGCSLSLEVFPTILAFATSFNRERGLLASLSLSLSLSSSLSEIFPND